MVATQGHRLDLFELIDDHHLGLIAQLLDVRRHSLAAGQKVAHIDRAPLLGHQIHQALQGVDHALSLPNAIREQILAHGHCGVLSKFLLLGRAELHEDIRLDRLLLMLLVGVALVALQSSVAFKRA